MAGQTRQSSPGCASMACVCLSASAAPCAHVGSARVFAATAVVYTLALWAAQLPGRTFCPAWGLLCPASVGTMPYHMPPCV